MTRKGTSKYLIIIIEIFIQVETFSMPKALLSIRVLLNCMNILCSVSNNNTEAYLLETERRVFPSLSSEENNFINYRGKYEKIRDKKAES